ncbi:MAG: chemotaxis-specific protein-glutamate methyltransferase CheB [Proteobacteria bacterium]|nr:chemotaxis-specific protein-glutamate methyltransferase CheB [Pseudomonadota bacterium]
MARKNKIKVLVIDDSAYNRRVLSDLIDAESDLDVVGKACDGEEGLQLAMNENPDVITLDLEMPRMDGFAFLRILMAKKPVPVIVISSHAEKEKVFRALELGALDFVAKPTHRISPAIKEIRREVIKKVRLARSMSPDSLHPFPPSSILEEPNSDTDTELPRSSISPTIIDRSEPGPKKETSRTPRKENLLRKTSIPSLAPWADPSPSRIVALAASTGGPAAVTQILTGIPAEINAGIVVVQHMPPSFTTTFADRLNRQCAIHVKEVTGIERIRRGSAYIAPGHACLEVSPSDEGLCAISMVPDPGDRYVPSADRLFHSIATTMGRNALAVVLTGMGDDGSAGIQDIAAAGGVVVAEDETTAVVFGMPQAAIKTGDVNHIAPLDRINAIIADFLGL